MSEHADDPAITEWAFAAARGDRRALESFIAATQIDVWRFIAYLADSRVADDLTQETFIRAMKALPRFSGRSTARTWLLAIARRVVVDQVRHDLARPRLAAADHRVTEAPQRHDEQVEWMMLIAGLDPERREALLLTQVLGLSYGEAAQVCGCPIGTIRSRVARARSELQNAPRADDQAV